MALSTESAGRVRSKVREHTKNPAIFLHLKAFFLWLSMYKKGLDLQFLPFTSTSIDDANGEVLVAGAGKIYAVYGDSPSAQAAASYLVLFDDASDDSGGATDARVVLPFGAAGNEAYAVFPDGISFAAGVVAKSYTTFSGTTDSTAGDAPNGFVIVAAS